MQQTMLKHYGQEFQQYLSTFILASLKCPEEIIRNYLQNMQAADQKQWRAFLRVRVACCCCYIYIYNPFLMFYYCIIGIRVILQEKSARIENEAMMMMTILVGDGEY